MATSRFVTMGKLGALEKWARCTDRTQATAAARAKFDQRFDLDQDEQLDPATRAACVKAARSAYFLRLQMKRYAVKKNKKVSTVAA
jgi:hypothetical protein